MIQIAGGYPLVFAAPVMTHVSPARGSGVANAWNHDFKIGGYVNSYSARVILKRTMMIGNHSGSQDTGCDVANIGLLGEPRGTDRHRNGVPVPLPQRSSISI